MIPNSLPSENQDSPVEHTHAAGDLPPHDEYTGADDFLIDLEDVEKLDGVDTAALDRLALEDEDVIRDFSAMDAPIESQRGLSSVRWIGAVSAPAGLNLRTAPTNQSEIVAILPDASPLSVLDEHGEWLQVSAADRTGYVYAGYVRRADPAPPPNTLLSAWIRYQDLLTAQSARLGIDPAVAVAVLMAESSGRAFGPDGRMIIRFEPHVFRRECGQAQAERFAHHFQFNPETPWQGHRWRPDPNATWREFHGNQHAEWEAFSFARSLHEEAAMRSISMGAPQIMGFNHATIGYRTAARDV